MAYPNTRGADVATPQERRICGGGDSIRLDLRRELTARLAVHVGHVGTYKNPTTCT